MAVLDKQGGGAGTTSNDSSDFAAQQLRSHWEATPHPPAYPRAHPFHPSLHPPPTPPSIHPPVRLACTYVQYRHVDMCIAHDAGPCTCTLCLPFLGHMADGGSLPVLHHIIRSSRRHHGRAHSDSSVRSHGSAKV